MGKNICKPFVWWGVNIKNINNLYNLIGKNSPKIQLKKKKRQRTWIDIFSSTNQERNEKSKPQWAIISHLLECLLSKRQEIIAGKDVEKRKSLCSIGGNVNLVQPLWKTVWKFFKKLKVELPFNSTPPFYMCVHIYICKMKSRYLHPHIHLSNIHKSQDMESVH